MQPHDEARIPLNLVNGYVKWHDLADDTIKDFHAEYGYVEKWYQRFWFKGYIGCRPYSVYERWLKTKSWH